MIILSKWWALAITIASKAYNNPENTHTHTPNVWLSIYYWVCSSISNLRNSLIKVGFEIITAPINPKTVINNFLTPVFSPSNIGAKIAVNNGLVIIKDIASPSGNIVIPLNQKIAHKNPITDLANK